MWRGLSRPHSRESSRLSSVKCYAAAPASLADLPTPARRTILNCAACPPLLSLRPGVNTMKFALFLTLLVPGLWAAAKPDLSGTWRLDPLRSRFDAIPAPKSAIIKISHQEPKIHLDLDMALKHNQQTEILDLVTDGSEQKVTIDGQPATATAYWEDDQHLVIEVKRDKQVETRRMHMGDKGKMLTTVLTVKDGGSEKSGYGFYTKE